MEKIRNVEHMQYSIQNIEDPSLKQVICLEIINQLPDWFGIPAANVAYAEQVKQERFVALMVNECAVGFISSKCHTSKSAEITVMGILENYHRFGLGGQLMTAMEAALKQLGIQYLSVKTLADTHECTFYKKTRLFYEKSGFVPLEIIPEIWGPENPCLIMVKHLEQQ